MKRNRPLNEKKRESILKAAIQEFYTKGYEGSSMDTISSEANVSKATVYNHFKNKQELFLAVANLLIVRFEESFKYPYDKQKSLTIQLKELAKKEMDFLSNKENITLIQIVTVVMIQKNEIGKKILEIAKEDNIIMTQKWFEDAKNDKKLDFDDSFFIAKQFIGMIKAFAFYPQLYGAPILTKKEQIDIINKSVDMIQKLYAL